MQGLISIYTSHSIFCVTTWDWQTTKQVNNSVVDCSCNVTVIVKTRNLFIQHMVFKSVSKILFRWLSPNNKFDRGTGHSTQIRFDTKAVLENSARYLIWGIGGMELLSPYRFNGCGILFSRFLSVGSIKLLPMLVQSVSCCFKFSCRSPVLTISFMMFQMLLKQPGSNGRET